MQKQILYSYGTHFHKPEENRSKYGQEIFYISYFLTKDKQDVISREEARCIILSIVESFLDAVNADPEDKKDLPIHPLTHDWVRVNIHFVDENHKDLKTGGVSIVYSSNDRIRYTTFLVPSEEKTFKPKTNYYEPYRDTMKIVTKQSCLKHY